MADRALRCSTVFVAIGETRGVYSSLKDMPAELRRQILDERSGYKTATLVIADKRGREELLRAARGDVSALRLRIAEPRPAPRLPRWLHYARIGVELLTLASAAALLWVVATAR